MRCMVLKKLVDGLIVGVSTWFGISIDARCPDMLLFLVEGNFWRWTCAVFVVIRQHICERCEVAEGMSCCDRRAEVSKIYNKMQVLLTRASIVRIAGSVLLIWVAMFRMCDTYFTCRGCW